MKSKALKSLLLTLILLGVFFLVHWFPPLNLIDAVTRGKLGWAGHSIWPINCIIFAWLFSVTTHTRFQIFAENLSASLKFLVMGLGLGTAIQVLAYLTAWRGDFGFSGFPTAEILIFQLAVASAEELLFRGVLQNFLASSVFNKISNKKGIQLFCAGILIALFIAALYGMHQVLRRQGGFDLHWFAGTFAFGFVAATAFSIRPVVIFAFGVHIAYTLIGILF